MVKEGSLERMGKLPLEVWSVGGEVSQFSTRSRVEIHGR